MVAPISHETPILVVGGGPIGLMSAYQLSRQGVQCLLVEQAPHTTKWPKVDLTNGRSMEILRMWGLVDSFRSKGVPSNHNLDSHFVTGFGPDGEKLTSWDLPSVDEVRAETLNNNDGSHPAEPYQRCSQIIFESWLKQKCIEQPLIEGHFGTKFVSAVEDKEGVSSTLVDQQGRTHVVRSKYVLGCDGGGSTTRRYAGVKMVGGPLPYVMYLTHFRSKELARLRPYGRFWHTFFTSGGWIVDQDEIDTFTSNLPIRDLDTDITKIDPKETVYENLGSFHAPFKFEIDEVLVSSAWRPNYCIADRYTSEGGRIILAGDSAHRSPPHGGYGMNHGIQEANDIGFKLAAAVKGFGGPLLLQSYETERRPVMMKALERSDHHIREHVPWLTWGAENPEIVCAKTPEGEALRKKIRDYLDGSGSECTNLGIEMDVRYNSPVIYQDTDGTKEPEWGIFTYTPGTWPGARAAHVFLKDGKTSILDLYGKGGWTLVEFTSSGSEPTAFPLFTKVAKDLNFPLTAVDVKDEDHVRKIWERKIVLVRPDGIVAWRNNTAPATEEAVRDILDVVLGQKPFPGFVPSPPRDANFKSIIEKVEGNPEGDPKFLAAFQKEIN